MDPKRGKPGIARSLLQRVSSKHDVHDQGSAASKSNSDPPMSRSTSAQTSAPKPSPSMDSPIQSNPPSIEHSVRLFRYYEALRSGDVNAVSRAVKDSIGGEADADTSTITVSGPVEGTSLLHLAIQCADLGIIEHIIVESAGSIDINARDKDGNSPLHVASNLSRAPVVKLLLDQKGINDSATNYNGKTPLDLAKSPEVFQQLQLARSMYIDERVKEVHELVSQSDYSALEKLLVDSHFQASLDVNSGELATDPTTIHGGGTLLHEAARKKDAQLIQILLLNGADPFRRDRKGKLPQDVTKDDKTRAILKKSPAAAAAQRGIQEKTILGSGPPPSGATPTAVDALGNKEAREMKGYLKKWTNYTSGYKLRWFVLEDGVLSYYKHQDDAGSACRGAINMKIAKLHMDPQDKVQFEIHGKSSVKYHLKANHQVEAKRWFWALNNAIQYSKDEAKEEQKQKDRNAEIMRQAKTSQTERLHAKDPDSSSITSSRVPTRLVPTPAQGLSRTTTEDEDLAGSVGEPSIAGDDPSIKMQETPAIAGDPDDDDEDYGDDASSIEARPVSRDAFMIAAHSARLQLDLLEQISGALQSQRSQSPETTLSEPNVVQAISSYEAAVSNLNGLIGDLGRIARDRESYWHFRVEQEVNVRRVWEESMAKVAQEHEELENKYGESEAKRKRTKRALRDALENQSQQGTPAPGSPSVNHLQESPLATAKPESPEGRISCRPRAASALRRGTLISEVPDISENESEDEEEFFDAIDEGKVEVLDEMPPQSPTPHQPTTMEDSQSKELRTDKAGIIRPSFKGYEDPVRTRLKLDADNRPKISLWGVLKSMIGKDMTKMTLPVSFNEPTNLLQRVAEDLEYTDLLNVAADRTDSTERMLYVAAFAASEFASTIGRVAKPFNPLLGETFEYSRPDKGYRFFTEQVSHHPPIGATWCESPKWDYYGESNVESKFYGKSFDFNHLGTWFLKLRPPVSSGSQAAMEEVYTWKKVRASVVGIITGNPTVDNYGPMEIKNHTTGETCLLDFKPRGWKASSAYQVTGKVLDVQSTPVWSIGGRWNDKLYARLTPGFQDAVLDASGRPSTSRSSSTKDPNAAFLVWEAHERPSNIPFNLTPFVMTLNALPERLKPLLPPTDTRLRPDQRAMEDGEYDFASKEKTRVEEKQRGKRRVREAKGDEWTPRWFDKKTDKATGIGYWDVKREDEAKDGEAGTIAYWECREKEDWKRCEDIF